MEALRSSDPRQLGPYKIIARLGSGGMGVVFLGSRGSARVAVKVMRSSFLDSPALRTRFEREIETLKKIKSSFVARYLDSDVEGDLVWHSVEFVNGPTLKEKIENDGPLDEGDWWALYSQMREALNDVHKLGLVHRDLKPANIILSEAGLKLIDFGIAQDSEATSLTSTGMVAGSPAWLSPEQLEGTEVGPGSDLFSAGSILTYAALGRSPWGKETTMTVPVAYKKILNRDFDLEALPSPYRAVVSRLFAERPEDRVFQSQPQESLPVTEQPSADTENNLQLEHLEGLSPSDGSNQPRRRLILAALLSLLLIAGLGTQALLGPESLLAPYLQSQAQKIPSASPATNETDLVREQRLEQCIDALAYVPERVSDDLQRKLDSAYASSLFTGSAQYVFENDPQNAAESLRESYTDLLLQIRNTRTEDWHPEATYSLGVTEQRILDAISRLNYLLDSLLGGDFAEFESAEREIKMVESLPPRYNIDQSVRNGDGYCLATR